MVVAPSATQAAFPGANGKIAFSRAGDVYTVNPDGADLTNLTNNPANDGSPAWSADGTKLAFVSDRDGNAEIYTMNADGSGVARLTNNPAVDSEPAWSPDGNRLVFASNREGGFLNRAEIYTMNADGSAQTKLLPFRGDSLDPVWSPNGLKIAFDHIPYPYPPEIGGLFGTYTVNSDGTGLAFVGGGRFPDWSPDGTKLVWSGITPTPTTIFPWDIYVVNADGSGETPITNDRPADYSPVWSPNGEKIAFFREFSTEDCSPSNPLCSLKIFTINPDGTGLARVTEREAKEEAEFSPDWQPVPNRQPDCSTVAAAPGTLGPPNHKLVSVSLSGASDADGDPVALRVTGVTQDEPVGGGLDAGAGATPDQVQLRAERDGGGNGRVYQVAFLASDGRGGTCTGTTKVGVPKGSGAAVDSGPSYDSFGP